MEANNFFDDSFDLEGFLTETSPSDSIKEKLMEMKKNEVVYFFIPKIGSRYALKESNEFASFLLEHKIPVSFDTQRPVSLKDGKYINVVFQRKNEA